MLLVPWIFACQADETPAAGQKVAPLSLTVTNVVTGKPILTEGQNSITIHWPKSMRQTALKLSWTAQGEGTVYQVHRSQSPTGPFSAVASTGAVQYVDTSVQPLITYHYVVKATGVGGNAESAVVMSTVLDAQGFFRGYNVYRSRSADGPFYKINPELVIEDSFTDGDLPSDSIYYYKVSVVYEHNLLGVVDADLETNHEMAFAWVPWGKTKPAKHKKISVAVHPCIVGATKKKARLIVRVYDQSGDIIKGLKKGNFKVDVDTAKTKVLLTWPVIPWGMQVGGIVMDYSGSMYATKADIPLMENMVVSGMVGAKTFWDRYEIIKYDTKIITYAKFTTDLYKLVKAVKKLDHKFSGATRYYDALGDSIDSTAKQKHPVHLLNSLFHKKFVVGFSDGEENSSKHNSDELIHKARTKCVPVFGVGYDGQIGSPGIKKMKNLTDNTGGVTFIAGPKSSGLFEKISKLVDTGYSVIIPRAASASSKHVVTVTVKYKGLKAFHTLPMWF